MSTVVQTCQQRWSDLLESLEFAKERFINWANRKLISDLQLEQLIVGKFMFHFTQIGRGCQRTHNKTQSLTSEVVANSPCEFGSFIKAEMAVALLGIHQKATQQAFSCKL